MCKVIRDIGAKDPSFRAEIKKSTIPKYHWLLILTSADKNKAHKLGMWFVTRTGFVLCRDTNLPCTVACPFYSKRCTRLVYALQYWVKQVIGKHQ